MSELTTIAKSTDRTPDRVNDGINEDSSEPRNEKLLAENSAYRRRPEEIASDNKAYDPATDLSLQRKLVEQSIEQIPESLKETVRGYVKQIDARVASGEVSKDEISKTFYQFNRLWQTESKIFDDDATSFKIALGILQHTATARNDQGDHDTCGAAALETKAFTAEPSKAAEMITTVALTGEWTAPDGKKIKIDPGSLVAGDEEQEFPPADGARSHASQIFQTTIINDVAQRQEPPREYVHSEQKSAIEQSVTNEYWRNADGSLVPFDGLSPDDIGGAAKRLFNQSGMVLNWENPYEKIFDPLGYLTTPPEKMNPQHVSEFNTREELESKLTEVAKINQYPVVIGVNSSNLPSVPTGSILERLESAYFSLVDQAATPLSSTVNGLYDWLGVANHAIAIKKYDQKQNRVFIGNSYGKDYDGWMTVDDLWKAI